MSELNNNTESTVKSEASNAMDNVISEEAGSDENNHDDIKVGSFPSESFEQAVELANRLKDNVNRALIGQEETVEMALTCLIAAGHLLIEGVPGLGKTLLVRSIAKSFDGEFSRIQFTPDLMPSDVTGHAMFDPKSEKFRLRKGPAFTNLLLADEINRAPAKTQSALLEVMQEKKITIEGKSHPVSDPFMVLATQNPLEQEGTYPLPEAELDRFLMNVHIGYPDLKDEVKLVKILTEGEVDDSALMREIEAITSPESILQLQKVAANIKVDDSLFEYAVNIVAASRDWSGVQMGASPRASIALIRAARALALVRGSDFISPDEIKSVALPVLRHRIVLSAELEIEGISITQVISDLLAQVAAPRE
ncbi:MoxR family ATPase [Aliikangiella sp. G2MR2-5]|uniref:AAA family ATPase n=1 Tax=Aliikangiella sp. G2MR2-5 TaxID=2788943 RepID=UPI001FEDD230|nr:MoxR family ATPase [Aliikangiella sp. G2MR2-5]